MIIIVLITTTTDSSLDIVRCTLVYCIILLIVMQGYFTKKRKKNERTNEPKPSEHPPRLWGEKTNTEYTGSLGYNSVFRVCYITSIIDDVVCRRDPGYVQYHRNNYMLS